MEMCSILLKTLVQWLCAFELVQTAEQIPYSISRLLYLANGKSDLLIEKEIFDQYLLESKKLIDDELSQLHDRVETLSLLNQKR